MLESVQLANLWEIATLHSPQRVELARDDGCCLTSTRSPHSVIAKKAEGRLKQSTLIFDY